jgi:hypothetical protein
MKIETLRDIALGALRSYAREIREQYGPNMKATIRVAAIASRGRIDTCSATLGLTRLVEEGKAIRTSKGGTPVFELSE